MRSGVGALASLVWTAVAVASGGCGSVPPTRYGVDSLDIEGVETFDPQSVENCLATRERERFGFRLGLQSAGECGMPPFDAGGANIQLWRWPWTEWPLLDRVVLEQDVERIERWYAARGHHQAQVTEISVVPAQAAERDIIDEDDPEPGCDRLDEDEGCTVDVRIVVEEGLPTIVSEIEIEGIDDLSEEVKREIEAAIATQRDARFDEHTYDTMKTAIKDALGRAQYARAEVEGTVRIDRPARDARISLRVDPGPVCVFGRVRIEGADDLPITTIRAATLIEEGDPYDPTVFRDAERAIYQIGAFSSVLVEPVIPEEGNVIDVKVTVRPARTSQFGLGVGFQSGIIEQSGGFEQTSVPQWDVHLLGTYRNRNFLGGLRQLELEERPRLIMLEPFPSVASPALGNTIRAKLDQPAFFEPRTWLTFDTSHDYGPDPFNYFFRHKIDSGLAVQRYFLNEQRLYLSFGIRNSIVILASGIGLVPDRCSDITGSNDVVIGQQCLPVEQPSDYHLTYLEQKARLDLRDDSTRPRAGFYTQVAIQEAGFGLPSSWSYIRIAPEIRFYIPLPLHMTLASRFGIGMYFITSAADGLDPISQELGPIDHRLRGGGASSNRGYLPGRLGDGLAGGTRRWEASTELRIPVAEAFETALFLDAGDVSRGGTFRLDHPQTSVGLGFRFYTLVTIRLDIAYRIPGLQVLAEDRRDPGAPESNASLFGLVEWPGAIHIAVGEPF